MAFSFAFLSFSNSLTTANSSICNINYLSYASSRPPLVTTLLWEIKKPYLAKLAEVTAAVLHPVLNEVTVLALDSSLTILDNLL